MERREFLESISPHPIRRPEPESISGSENRKIQAGLEEKTTPLTWEEAAHLLRRMSFGPKSAEINSFVGLTPRQAIERLLGDGSEILPNAEDSLSWIGEAIQDPITMGTNQLRFKQEGILKNRYTELVRYLTNLMKDEDLTSSPAIEKPTLFLMSVWNIEFTYDTRAFVPPNLLWRNNKILRNLRMGNYSDIAKEMTLDGAFLLYQSLQLSTKSAPNENFARELMELFTMGIGNYTEGDIQEASRILTGWRTSPYSNAPNPNGFFETYFSPNDHDIESKQVMGIAFPARTPAYNNENKVKIEEVHKLVDVLFERRPLQIARFIMEKMYRFFVYSNPGSDDQGVIDELATYFEQSNFELREAYIKLFSSEHFYEDANRGVQIKMPIDYLVGLDRQTGHDDASMSTSIARLEQSLYDPPNVSGWKFYRSWISTTTYPARVFFAYGIIEDQDPSDFFALAQDLPGTDTLDNFVLNLTNFVFPKPVNEVRLFRYKQVFLDQGITDENWADRISSQSSSIGIAIKEVFRQFIKAPDFQLI